MDKSIEQSDLVTGSPNLRPERPVAPFGRKTVEREGKKEEMKSRENQDRNVATVQGMIEDSKRSPMLVPHVSDYAGSVIQEVRSSDLTKEAREHLGGLKVLDSGSEDGTLQNVKMRIDDMTIGQDNRNYLEEPAKRARAVVDNEESFTGQ